MAVIRLQVEVDSDVYPELYARLRAIPRPQGREERLRQLAASGLVWEAVRMHGPAATASPPPVEPSREVPVLVDVVDDAPATVVQLHVDVPASPPPDEPPLPPPLHTAVQAPAAPKSKRLKRMVDRGLFRNG